MSIHLDDLLVLLWTGYFSLEAVLMWTWWDRLDGWTGLHWARSPVLTGWAADTVSRASACSCQPCRHSDLVAQSDGWKHRAPCPTERPALSSRYVCNGAGWKEFNAVPGKGRGAAFHNLPSLASPNGTLPSTFKAVIALMQCIIYQIQTPLWTGRSPAQGYQWQAGHAARSRANVFEICAKWVWFVTLSICTWHRICFTYTQTTALTSTVLFAVGGTLQKSLDVEHEGNSAYLCGDCLHSRLDPPTGRRLVCREI